MNAPSAALVADIEPCCDDETWEPIPSWPHEASTCGRVRSVDRLEGDVWHLGGLLAVSPDRRPGKGYLYVTLTDGPRRRKIHLAVAVLEAHRGLKQMPEHEARHGNGVRTDNHLSNLSWGTKKQNRADRERHRMERQQGIQAAPAPSGLITLREAEAGAMFPVTWGRPAAVFRTTKHRAAQTGMKVPEVKAMRGVVGLYDAAEIAEFVRQVAGFREDGEEFTWFSSC